MLTLRIFAPRQGMSVKGVSWPSAPSRGSRESSSVGRPWFPSSGSTNQCAPRPAFRSNSRDPPPRRSPFLFCGPGSAPVFLHQAP